MFLGAGFSVRAALLQDWSDATVVFAMSLCFPEEMMQAGKHRLSAKTLRTSSSGIATSS